MLVHNHCGVRPVRHLAHGSRCEWVRQLPRCPLSIPLLYPSTAYRPPCCCTISAACFSLCWSLLHVDSSPAGCRAERCLRPLVSHATKLARCLHLLRKTPESSTFPRSLRCCAIPRLHFPSLLPACPHKDPGLRCWAVLRLRSPSLLPARSRKHRPGGLVGHSLRAATRKIQSSRRSHLRLVAPPPSTASRSPRSTGDPLGYRSQQRLSKRFHSTAWCRKRQFHGRGAVPGLALGAHRPQLRTRLSADALLLRSGSSRRGPVPHRRQHFEFLPRAFSGFFSGLGGRRRSSWDTRTDAIMRQTLEAKATLRPPRSDRGKTGSQRQDDVCCLRSRRYGRCRWRLVRLEFSRQEDGGEPGF